MRKTRRRITPEAASRGRRGFPSHRRWRGGRCQLYLLALRKGVNVSGLPEAITCASDWLALNRFAEWGVNWPTAVPLVQADSGWGPQLAPGSAASAPDGPSRCAWCYGSPGIARSLAGR